MCARHLCSHVCRCVRQLCWRCSTEIKHPTLLLRSCYPTMLGQPASQSPGVAPPDTLSESSKPPATTSSSFLRCCSHAQTTSTTWSTCYVGICFALPSTILVPEMFCRCIALNIHYTQWLATSELAFSLSGRCCWLLPAL